MPQWLTGLLLVVAVIAVALLRERWRVRRLDAWIAERGLRRPERFVPGDRPPLATLVKRFDIRGGRLWGAGVEGALGGVEATAAEHETSPPGKKTGVWQTAVAWPAPSLRDAGPLVLWPGAGGTMAGPLARVGGSSYQNLCDRLGVPDQDPGGLCQVTPGGVLVEGEPSVRAAWLTESRVRGLESWRHGGAFVVDRGWVAWRLMGTLTVERLETVGAHLPEARQFLE